MSSISIINVSIQIRDNLTLSVDRNYMFHSKALFDFNSKDNVFTHIVDVNMNMIQIRNVFHETIIISRHAKLKRVMNYKKKNCYLTSSNDAHLIVKSKKQIFKKFFKLVLIDLVTAVMYIDIIQQSPFSIITTKIVTTNIFDVQHITVTTVSKTKSFLSIMKAIFFRKIIIYENEVIRVKLKTVIDRFSKLWIDRKQIINISKNEWMSIDIISSSKIFLIKPYSLSQRNKNFIDKKFDKLHQKNKMKWTIEVTFYDASIFVMWRNITIVDQKKPKCKKRTIVNIRSFNRIMKSNSYFMQLQSDITSTVQNCTHITIVNYNEFFHQWLMQKKNRFKLTIIFHKNSEHFNVTIMSFKKTSIYVQRKIDQIIKKYELQKFTRTYINDIVIFNQSLKKHLKHLVVVFEVFFQLRITLKSFKVYIDYLFVILLEQYVIAFEFITIIEKLKAISKLRFSITFKELEHYLKLIDWLRSYVKRYVQKIESLTRRKTKLLRQFFSNKKKQRKIFNLHIVIDQSSSKKRTTYEFLQLAFSSFTFLTHFDQTRILFINVNVFKKYDFGIMIYHVKNKSKYRDNSKQLMTRTNIKLILFLSKCLTNVEDRYWFIELKIADLIWIIRHVRHMIKIFLHFVVVYIDYSATTFIVQQIKLFIFFVNKLNLRLIRASIYLFQFTLDIRHKSNVHHIVSNALFKLSIDEKKSSSNLVLNDVYSLKLVVSQYVDEHNLLYSKHVVNGIHVQMSSNFKNVIVKNYQKNKAWRQILDLVVIKRRIILVKKKSLKI